jgi:D-arabinan exo alpha-(1,3)/(1,5)-arabinofuranosidase (non-reducing end)
MPFASGVLITLENRSDEQATCYYQVDYTLERGIDPLVGYFHAQWRRSNPLPYKTSHTILDLPMATGRGHYVGTYVAWGVNNSGWWGEGELKVYLDGDGEYPTICGTGTEDYFGGAWNFDLPGRGYTEYSTPYLGLNQVIRPDGLYQSQHRFGMYRWHIPDPIVFADSIRVDIQALGWRSGHRYLPLQDDIASTAVFYLDRTSTARPVLPDRDALEVV